MQEEAQVQKQQIPHSKSKIILQTTVHVEHLLFSYKGKKQR